MSTVRQHGPGLSSMPYGHPELPPVTDCAGNPRGPGTREGEGKNKSLSKLRKSEPLDELWKFAAKIIPGFLIS